jgi:hypothetical protein
MNHDEEREAQVKRARLGVVEMPTSEHEGKGRRRTKLEQRPAADATMSLAARPVGLRPPVSASATAARGRPCWRPSGSPCRRMTDVAQKNGAPRGAPALICVRGRSIQPALLLVILPRPHAGARTGRS